MVPGRRAAVVLKVSCRQEAVMKSLKDAKLEELERANEMPCHEVMTKAELLRRLNFIADYCFMEPIPPG
jgi:hypothetical protein